MSSKPPQKQLSRIGLVALAAYLLGLGSLFIVDRLFDAEHDEQEIEAQIEELQTEIDRLRKTVEFLEASNK